MSNQHKLHKRYMPGLDGLRTLAVLFVVLYHLNVNWAPGGLLGVSIFFVLSGYLITDLLTAEWSRTQTIDLKAFWIRRCRRLLPAMLVMMAAIVAWVTLFNPSLLSVLRGDVVSSIFYVNNWYLIFHQVSYFEKFGPVSPFGHMWSLAVEEQFYLLWPLLLLLAMKLLKKRGPVFLFILTAAAVSAIMMLILYDPDADPSRVYYGTDTRAFSLLIGAALSIVWPSRKLTVKAGLQTRLVLNAAGVIGLVSVFLMVWKTNEYDSFLYPGGFLLLSVLTAMIIASAAHPASMVGKLLGMKPLRWLGLRSYSIYIWHYPVIILTTQANSDPEVWRAILQSAASVLLASLSFKYIEEPIRGGLIGRLWNKFRKGHVNLSNVPLRGWLTSASVLVMVVVSCAGFALRTPVNASTLKEEASPASASVAPMNRDGDSPETKASEQPSSRKPVQEQIPPRDQPDSNPEAHPEPDSGLSAEQNKHTTTASPNPEEVHNTQPHEDKTDKTVKSVNSDLQDPSETNPKSGKTAPAGESKDSNSTAPDSSKAGKSAVPITAIGDSVMLDAEPFLQKLISEAVIDAKIGRQMSEAPGLIASLRAQGKLGDQVVIELGTNGPFSSKQLMSLLDSLQDVRKVVLVNARVPRSWESVVNASIKKAAAAYPNTTLLDWHAASSGKSYFEPDGVHLKPQGGKILAGLIAGELGYKTK
ncbi:acyltransferase family protein [Paenibacillus sp. HJL G12]|uniref:Acyltransferase family protein n=1 Tax=Paenibacillus dendrobii TaxID=2691084 RepID=A0A7X3IFX5_9BACL|nr:acyltransferase family protein [Paenibacillus dendrobii]MWV43194.1 acyltransferase family protein [Paenibacillus dendrobii]